MNVRVKVLGALAKPFGKDDLTVEVAEACTVGQLLLTLGYAQAHLRVILPSVRGEQRGLGSPLSEGDEVTLFLPSSGG